MLHKERFTPNPYNTCVMNKTIEESQRTIMFHVDDLKISHVSEAVVNYITLMLGSIFGDVTARYDMVHTYFDIDFDMSIKN